MEQDGDGKRVTAPARLPTAPIRRRRPPATARCGAGGAGMGQHEGIRDEVRTGMPGGPLPPRAGRSSEGVLAGALACVRARASH